MWGPLCGKTLARRLHKGRLARLQFGAKNPVDNTSQRPPGAMHFGVEQACYVLVNFKIDLHLSKCFHRLTVYVNHAENNLVIEESGARRLDFKGGIEV